MRSPVPVTPVRKSGRARQPNKKYGADTFAGLDILSSASEEEVEAWKQLGDSENDEEFDESRVVEEAQDPEEDEISSAEAFSDGSGIATPVEESDDAADDDNDRAPEDGPPLKAHKANYSHLYRKRRPHEAGTHIRGIAESAAVKAKGSKADYNYALFGNAPKDLLHVARSRDQWADASTLPRRPNESGSRGMRPFFSHTEEKRRMEATVGWDWYYVHGGRTHMATVQQSRPLSSEEGIRYVPRPPHPHRTVFMGPYGRQTRFDLSLFQPLALGEAGRMPLNQMVPKTPALVGPEVGKAETDGCSMLAQASGA